MAAVAVDHDGRREVLGVGTGRRRRRPSGSLSGARSRIAACIGFSW